MNISKQLFELQKIDLQINEWIARQVEIKAILADDSKIESSEKEMYNLGSRVIQTEKDLKVAEYEVNAQIEKLKVNESRLYGGKINSPKELNDLQNEAAAFKKRLSSLEDNQLDCMMKYEEADDEHKNFIEAHDKLLQDTIISHGNLNTEYKHLTDDIINLSPIRDSAAQSFDPDQLKLYEKIRKKRKGIAVVKFKDNSCTACGASMTSSQAQLARSPSKVTLCESCDRIFYSD